MEKMKIKLVIKKQYKANRDKQDKLQHWIIKSKANKIKMKTPKKMINNLTIKIMKIKK